LICNKCFSLLFLSPSSIIYCDQKKCFRKDKVKIKVKSSHTQLLISAIQKTKMKHHKITFISLFLTSSKSCAAISNRVESRLLSRKDALYRPISRPISGVSSCSVMACKYVIVLNHITYVCVFLQSKQTFSNSSTPNCNIVEKSFTYSDDENPLPHDLQ
jgi:hypothetical protein